MITREKMAEKLDLMAASVRQMPEEALFFRAEYSSSGGLAELLVGTETMNSLIGSGKTIYSVTPWEDYDLIEISSQKGGVKVYALYTEEEFKKFREMEKTPDAATSEVKEEEFAERMNDLRNLLLPDIVTPADEEVKEGETI